MIHILLNTPHRKDSPVICSSLITHLQRDRETDKREQKKRGGYGGKEKGNKLRETEREVIATV